MKVIRRHRRRNFIYLVIILVLIGAYCYWALHKPLPLLQPAVSTVILKTNPPGSQLGWPASQSAVGIVDSDIIETHGPQKPVPIASVAKVITALVVLDAKPLNLNQTGPVITLTDADVALFQHYVSVDGSLLPVKAGQQISEYQMIQALMLPSANNIADTMAIWAFGSLKDYSAAANTYLAKNKLTNTHVGDDASGLSPTTTSTAEDLIKLGKLAMQSPVLAQIASQPSATGLPNVPVVKNVNSLLGTNNIIGIKTGNTDQAGGVFLSASKVTVNNKPVIIITAVAGEPSLFGALKNSLTLIRSAQANFQSAQIIKANTVVGTYKVPWGGQVSVVASKDLAIDNWKGAPTKAVVALKPIAYNDQTAGTISLSKSSLYNPKSVAVVTKDRPTQPTAWWRLTHPIN